MFKEYFLKKGANKFRKNRNFNNFLSLNLNIKRKNI